MQSCLLVSREEEIKFSGIFYFNMRHIQKSFKNSESNTLSGQKTQKTQKYFIRISTSMLCSNFDQITISALKRKVLLNLHLKLWVETHWMKAIFIYWKYIKRNSLFEKCLCALKVLSCNRMCWQMNQKNINLTWSSKAVHHNYFLKGSSSTFLLNRKMFKSLMSKDLWSLTGNKFLIKYSV